MQFNSHSALQTCELHCLPGKGRRPTANADRAGTQVSNISAAIARCSLAVRHHAAMHLLVTVRFIVMKGERKVP